MTAKADKRIRNVSAIRLRAYPIIDRAVEEGIAYGYRRAYKHTDDPQAEDIQEQIRQAVMQALCDVLEFAPFEEEGGP